MRYVLGVDAGGSKTLAAIAEETGRVLGIGRAGSGSHQAMGLAGAMEQVRAAATDALERAGLQRSEVDGAAYCLAGADLPEDFDLLRPALGELALSARWGLENDIVASLRSATDSPNVVVVGWGSGTNALGRNAAGSEIRLPALGWISGDWGGGSDLGREAVWLVARAHDGRGEPTALREPILQALEDPDVDAMIRKLYFKTGRRVPTHTLAPIVFRVAEAGDCAARGLVERAGVEIATTALAMLTRLDLLATAADVVLAGSIFRAESPLLMEIVETGLRDRAPLARIVVPDVEPVVGAVFVAFDLLGIPVSVEVRARAKGSYEHLAGNSREEIGA
jgi:N-acetylglucosamine kinase-like BadF-type ATPase